MTRVMHVISGLGHRRRRSVSGSTSAGTESARLRAERGQRQRSRARKPAVLQRGDTRRLLNVGSLTGRDGGVGRLARLVRERKPDVCRAGCITAICSRPPRTGRARRRGGCTGTCAPATPWRAATDGWFASMPRLSAWPDTDHRQFAVWARFSFRAWLPPARDRCDPERCRHREFRPDPVDRTALRAELGTADDAIVAIHVARLNPMKDHASFLKAMQALPQMRGLLVGAGTETLDLPGNVGALGLRRMSRGSIAAPISWYRVRPLAKGFRMRLPRA